LEEGDSGRYNWPSLELNTGVTANRSEIGMDKVLDGSSKTYLVGEKYLNPDSYLTGNDWGDNHNLFSGDDMEIVRFGAVGMPPAQDRPGLIAYFAFGSAHAAGCHMAMCDGSIRQIRYDVDFEIHRRLANRRDEQAIHEAE
jgi:hypothetical protein